MKIFIDTADIKEIRECADQGVIDGVTTNPSLVAKSGRRFRDVLVEICEVVKGPVSAEVTALEHQAMMKEARDYAKIALVGLEPELLKEVAGRLHTEADWWEADVTDHEAMARVAGEVKERFGKVDVVVANAGVAAGGPFVDSDPVAWRRVIEVNLVGSAVTGRVFLPALVESRGYLLQIASLAAITPAPMMTAYCASKAGVEAYAHSLRAEVGHKGVGVGVAYLSWTDTDMVRGADQEHAMRELRQRLPWPWWRPHRCRWRALPPASGVASAR